MENINYTVTIDSIEAFVPIDIPKDSIEQMQQYALKLRLACPAKKVQLWKFTTELIEL